MSLSLPKSRRRSREKPENEGVEANCLAHSSPRHQQRAGAFAPAFLFYDGHDRWIRTETVKGIFGDGIEFVLMKAET